MSETEEPVRNIELQVPEIEAQVSDAEAQVRNSHLPGRISTLQVSDFGGRTLGLGLRAYGR